MTHIDSIITWVSSPVGLGVSGYLLKVLISRIKTRKKLPTPKQAKAVVSIRNSAIHFNNGVQSLKPFLTIKPGDLSNLQKMSNDIGVSIKALNPKFAAMMMISDNADGKHVMIPIVAMTSQMTSTPVSGCDIMVSG